MTLKEELQLIREQRKEQNRKIQYVIFYGFLWCATAYFTAHVIAWSWR